MGRKQRRRFTGIEKVGIVKRRLVDLCAAGEWDAASRMQAKFNAWETSCVEPLVKQGYLHGIVGKARCAASGFLEDKGYTLAPYQPMPTADVQALANDYRRWWSDEFAEENWLNG